MNTPNPLVPQGSLQEQSKRKSQLRIIVFSILVIHVVLLGALLIQGCKREEPPPAGELPPPPPPPITNTKELPPPPPPPLQSNVVVPLPPLTNLVDTPPAGPTEHVIQKGESFATLAKKYGVSVKAIQEANPGVEPTKLKINQKINIPPKPPTVPGTSSRTPEPAPATGETIHTVKKGDNLTKIAQSYGVTVKAIRTANNLRTDQIKEGQKLKIPAKAAAPAPAAPTPIAPPGPAPTAAPLPPSTPSNL